MLRPVIASIRLYRFCHGKNSSSAFILDPFLIAMRFDVRLSVNDSFKTSVPGQYVRKRPTVHAV